MSQYIWREVSQLSDFAFQMFTFVTFFICLGAFVKHDFENHYIWYKIIDIVDLIATRVHVTNVIPQQNT